MADKRSIEEFDIFKDDKRRIKFLVAGSVAILVVCLIVVLFAVRSVRDIGMESEETGSTEVIEQSEAPIVADTSIPFTACDDQTIVSLVQDYFDARLSGDSAAIYTLFGRSDTSQDDSLQNRLKTQAGWIQGFNDITVYSVPGTTDGELLCLVTYTIDFRRTDAMAPGVMYFYVYKTEDENYIIEETLSKEKVDYANAFLEAESASSIIDLIDTQLSENLAADSTLALIYTSFVNGDIYSEADLEAERDPEVDIVFDAADSVLVGESDLANMSAEASEAASREAAENVADYSAAAATTESSSQAGIATDSAAESEDQVSESVVAGATGGDSPTIDATDDATGTNGGDTDTTGSVAGDADVIAEDDVIS